MSALVRHFMNTQIVYLRAGDRPEIALQPMLDFGITAVPVLDESERPLGVVLLRDLVNPRKRGSRVTETVVTIGIDEPIGAAARLLADTGAHHLIVLDEGARAAGMLSAVDIVRALIGLEPKHPATIDAFGRRRSEPDGLADPAAAAT